MMKQSISRQHTLAALSFAVALSAALVVATGITRADSWQCDQDQAWALQSQVQLGADEEGAFDASQDESSDLYYEEIYCNQYANTYSATGCEQETADVQADIAAHNNYVAAEPGDQTNINEADAAVSADCTDD